MPRKPDYYRLVGIYINEEDREVVRTAACVTCLATGEYLAGMGGGGEFLSAKAYERLKAGELQLPRCTCP